MDRGKRAFDLRVEGTMFQVSVRRHGHGASGIDRKTASWGSRRSDLLCGQHEDCSGQIPE